MNSQAIDQAKANLTDIKERGADALGSRWSDARKNLLTPEERAASAIRVGLMTELIHARNRVFNLTTALSKPYNFDSTKR